MTPFGVNWLPGNRSSSGAAMSENGGPVKKRWYYSAILLLCNEANLGQNQSTQFSGLNFPLPPFVLYF